MNIIIGSDHAGYELKEACKAFLQKLGHCRVTDVGVFSLQSSDYPPIAHKVGLAISKGEYSRGILVCGSGIGMSVVANRYRGVRAALCHDLYAAKMARLHNDANILALGGRVTAVGLSLEILEVFLNTGFEGGRHQSRVDQIDA